MADTNFEHKFILLKAELKVLKAAYKIGSPVTMNALHNEVTKIINWTPSTNTISNDLKMLVKHGVIKEFKIYGNNQRLYSFYGKSLTRLAKEITKKRLEEVAIKKLIREQPKKKDKVINQ